MRAILRRTGWGLALLGLTLLGGDASGQAQVDDSAPAGTVAFFTASTCPAGWVRADYTNGRLVVGVIDGSEVGVTAGTPLGDREDRTHQHAFAGQVTLTQKGIAASDGLNNEGARAQTYQVAGDTDAAPSGLPFIQLLACEKQ